MPRLLLWASLGHAVLAVALGAALARPTGAVLGVHPALKPFKFAISIAIFLGTMGGVVPCLAVGAPTREALAGVFAVTMVLEMVPIVGQALRGTTSHFNVRGGANTLAWNVMFLAIVVATAAMGFVTLVATARPLLGASGQPLPAVMQLALRAGLWLLLLTPVSGFAMGGRMRHSIGGVDGGPGLRLVNWSTEHGDLRVAHFFALHALQLLPLVAWALLGMELGEGVRMGILAAAVAAVVVLCVGTLTQAFRGQPFLR
jgi:hypothetical protein